MNWMKDQRRMRAFALLQVGETYHASRDSLSLGRNDRYATQAMSLSEHIWQACLSEPLI